MENSKCLAQRPDVCTIFRNFVNLNGFKIQAFRFVLQATLSVQIDHGSVRSSLIYNES